MMNSLLTEMKKTEKGACLEKVESLVLNMWSLRFLVLIGFQMEIYSWQLDTCVWSEKERLDPESESEES